MGRALILLVVWEGGAPTLLEVWVGVAPGLRGQSSYLVGGLGGRSSSHQWEDADMSVKWTARYHGRIAWTPLHVKAPLVARRQLMNDLHRHQQHRTYIEIYQTQLIYTDINPLHSHSYKTYIEISVYRWATVQSMRKWKRDSVKCSIVPRLALTTCVSSKQTDRQLSIILVTTTTTTTTTTFTHKTHSPTSATHSPRRHVTLCLGSSTRYDCLCHNWAAGQNHTDTMTATRCLYTPQRPSVHSANWHLHTDEDDDSQFRRYISVQHIHTSPSKLHSLSQCESVNQAVHGLYAAAMAAMLMLCLLLATIHQRVHTATQLPPCSALKLSNKQENPAS